MADSHESGTKPFSYDLPEADRVVTESAPAVPPEFLKRIAPKLPVVAEADRIIGEWYVLLSHMFYEEVKAKMVPGALDAQLARMHNWLAEIRGVSHQRHHPEPAPPVKRWAVCTFYQPFRLGGPNIYKRFEVDAVDVNLGDGITGFVFFDPHAAKYKLHELTTGGFLCEAETVEKAIRTAEVGLADTPDFKDQMKKMGDPSGFEVVDADTALKKLAKSK
jgi:hypothetical protein